MLMSSIIGYLGLLDLGLKMSVIKYISHYRASEKPDEINSFASTILVVYTIVGLVAFIASAVVGRYAYLLFDLSVDIRGLVQNVFILGGANLAVSFPLGLLGGILRGFHRYDIDNWATIGSTLLSFIFTIILLNVGYGLVSLVLLSLIVNVVMLLVRALYVTKILNIRISPLLANKTSFREAVTYSSWVFLLSIAGRMAFHTDNVVISLFISVAAITFYTIAFRLVDIVTQIVFNTVDVLFPVFSELAVREETDRIQQIFLLGIKLSLVIALPFFIIFWFMGPSIIEAWIGPGYDSSYPPLLILTIALLFHFPGHIAALLLLGTGRHKILALIALSDSALNLMLSILLVKQFGLVGVASGTAISLGISNGLIIPLYVCRMYKIPFTKYLMNLLRPLAVGAIVTGATGMLYSFRSVTVPNKIEIVIFSILIFTAFIGLYYIGAMRPGERAFIQDRLRSLFRS